MSLVDSSTRELFQLRLKRADHLVFSPRRYGGQLFYHLEDTSRGRYFRLGYPEYVFVSLLDGSTTVAEALAATARTLGRDALSESRAVTICHWLINEDLVAQFADSVSMSNGQHASGRAAAVSISPFYTRIPLCCPDALLKRLVPILGWLYHPVAMAVWGGLMLYAVMTVCTHWDRVIASAAKVFCGTAWIWLVVSWVVLKLLHEFSHGLACRRYGGRVGTMGIALILLAPLPYVDVTSSWSFRSKWQRIVVAAAGIYLEGWLTAIAVIWWSQTRSEVLSSLLYNSIVVSAISTVIFNGNPFVRSDGYYILTDLLEIPNLSARGTTNLRTVTRHWIFGIRSDLASDQSWRNRVATLYALCTTVWSLTVCFGLIVAASVMWHGAGVVFALLGIFIWCIRPMIGFVLLLLSDEVCRPAPLLRAGTIAAGLCGFCWVIFNHVPCPAAYQSPGIIDFTDLAHVRPIASGFVRKIHVVDGQQVVEGELLVELQNEDLEVECRDLELAIEQSKARARIARYSGQIGQAQIEEANCQAYEDKLSERAFQLENLAVRAPQSGRVIARELAALLDTFVKEGSEILAIGDEFRKEMQFSIAQQDVSTFEQQQTVSVRLADGTRFDVPLTRISPRGSYQPSHVALGAAVGGPLPVIERVIRPGDGESTREYQFPEPRFRAVCVLPASSQFVAGGQGVVYPISSQRTIGQWLTIQLSQGIESLRRKRDAAIEL